VRFADGFSKKKKEEKEGEKVVGYSQEGTDWIVTQEIIVLGSLGGGTDIRRKFDN